MDGSVVNWIGLESSHVSGLVVREPYLWFIDRDENQIVRIDIRAVSFRGEAPHPVFGRSGREPLTISFEERTIFGEHGFVADEWLWSFGDGARGTGPRPVHTYLQEGNYSVSLVVTSGPDVYYGQEAHYVHVEDTDPIAQFRVKPDTPNNGPPPLDVSFEEFSWSYDGITDRLWEFGDGSESRQANATHIYTQPGIYDVSLTVFEADGDCDKITRQKAVLVSEGWFPATLSTLMVACIARRIRIRRVR